MADYSLLSLLVVLTIFVSLWCLHLSRDLQRALTDQTYGILTRAGGERAWEHLRRRYLNYEVIFLDLDELHLRNAELGYIEVDGRIRASLSRRQRDIVTARWYSGDEIVAVVPRGDGLGFSRRLLDRLKAQGLSGTFGVVPATPRLIDAVQNAMKLVAEAKLNGRRGTVYCSEPYLGTPRLAPRAGVGRRSGMAARKVMQP